MGAISHFLSLHIKIPHSLRFLVNNNNNKKCFFESWNLKKCRLQQGEFSPFLSIPWCNFLSASEQSCSSEGHRPDSEIWNFKNAIKLEPSSPGRSAAAGWPLMKWLLKEVGRLIPAAERGAGQWPRNAQPGWGKTAAASQPRARPNISSVCSLSLRERRRMPWCHPIGTYKAGWAKRHQSHLMKVTQEIESCPLRPLFSGALIS
jgi:hypothetical protein